MFRFFHRRAHIVPSAGQHRFIRECTLVRQIDAAGFNTVLAPPQPTPFVQTPEQSHAYALAAAGKNFLVTGPNGTGKMTLLRGIYQSLKDQGKSVGIVSTRSRHANQLGGLTADIFFGLKHGILPVSNEQAVAILQRHLRLMNSDSYESAFATVGTLDVLLIDGIELINNLLFLAVDSVSRIERKEPNKPFGGLQVICGADWWSLPKVHPACPNDGYLFQNDKFLSLFPDQILLQRFWRHTEPQHHITYHQTPKIDDATRREKGEEFSHLTLKALYGKLTEKDCKTLEQLTVPDPSLPVVRLVDNAHGLKTWAPRFSKYLDEYIIPEKVAHLRRTAFGNFMTGVLAQIGQAWSFGMNSKVDVQEGTLVALTHALYSSSGALIHPQGKCGIVRKAEQHHVTIDFDGKVHRIGRLCITSFHEVYPTISASMRQFPLLKVNDIFPLALKKWDFLPTNLLLDGRFITETNELGLLLGRSRGPYGLSLENVYHNTKREGLVHDPAKHYYEELLRNQCKAPWMSRYEDERTRKSSKRTHSQKVLEQIFPPEQDERWCKNCKAFMHVDNFFKHWKECTVKLRWCKDCSTTIPIEKWEAHEEKHTVVLCVDCAKALEWRHWDQHRLSCGAMLRELTAENTFLPDTTVDQVLSSGFDRRDLHTVTKITKSTLPRSKKGPVKSVTG